MRSIRGLEPQPATPALAVPRSLLVSERRLQDFVASRIIGKRAASSAASATASSSSCDKKDSSCERYFKPSDNTLPIVLGVVIPLAVAFCVLIFLHRRHVQKLKREDAEDKTKSLDFGMSGVQFSEKHRKSRRGGPNNTQMSTADAISTVRHDRGGISLDMTMSHPYLLPPELHQSRESLHSLSRSLNTGDDKYRATDFIPDDGSIRSPSSMKSHWDNASTYTGSSRPRLDSESTKNLIPYSSRTEKPVPQIRKPLPVAKDAKSTLVVPGTDEGARESYVSTSSSNGNVAALRASNNYLGQFISGGQKPDQHQNPNTDPEEMDAHVAELDSGSSAQQSSRGVLGAQELPAKRSSTTSGSAGFNFGIPSGVQELPSRYSGRSHAEQEILHPDEKNRAIQDRPLPEVNVTASDDEEYLPPSRPQRRQSSVYQDNFKSFQNHPHAYEWPNEQGAPPSSDQASAYDHATHSDHQPVAGNAFGARQDADHPAPSDREHGDHRSPRHSHQTGHSGYSEQHGPDMYVEHYGAEDYYDDEDEHNEEGYDINAYKDALGYDPRLLNMGMRPLPPDDPTENPEERALKIRSFYKEYFDEVAKPGGGNRLSYFDGSENYIEDYYGTAQSSPYGSRGPSMSRPATQQQRHRAMSNGSYGPRAFSSASGRYGRPSYRPNPRVRLPPPKDLNVLPTPHMLKDDSMLPNAIDYAPPQVFKNQRAGTPESLRGGVRPYSPSTRAFNPLVSSFDDLSALPSPHQLRKSSTFTSLDFAPPRFQAKETFSDAGSIRSNHSGVSALHQHNIRAGAYRISRLPREVAGTRDELADALRPQWNMHR